MGTSQPQGSRRPVAAGGWRRAVVGLFVGAVAGTLAVATLPDETAASGTGRDGASRRRRRGR